MNKRKYNPSLNKLNVIVNDLIYDGDYINALTYCNELKNNIIDEEDVDKNNYTINKLMQVTNIPNNYNIALTSDGYFNSILVGEYKYIKFCKNYLSKHENNQLFMKLFEYLHNMYEIDNTILRPHLDLLKYMIKYIPDTLQNDEYTRIFNTIKIISYPHIVYLPKLIFNKYCKSLLFETIHNCSVYYYDLFCHLSHKLYDDNITWLYETIGSYIYDLLPLIKRTPLLSQKHMNVNSEQVPPWHNKLSSISDSDYIEQKIHELSGIVILNWNYFSISNIKYCNYDVCYNLYITNKYIFMKHKHCMKKTIRNMFD